SRLLGAGLHGRERPAVAGEFACDRDRDDRASLATPLERLPATVETARASLGLGTNSGRLSLPAPRQDRALPQRPALVPGGLDEQSAGVAVAGLGDRAELTPLTAGVLARGQAQERSQRLRAEAHPVAELDRERERRQRPDTAQTAEPPDDLGERRLASQLGDRLIERVS